MMEKVGRIFRWIATNAAFMAFGIFGLILKVNWCENIFLFFTYLFFVLILFGFFHEETKLKIREKGRSVPQWISIIYDVIIVCMFAAVGRFFTATIWFLQMCFEFGIYNKEEPKKDEK